MPADARLLAGLLCLIAVPAPAAAQAGGAPNATSEVDQAQAQIGDLEARSREQPQDPTILRLLGARYAAARRYDEAAAVLARAQALAPHDQDIALARARVALWSGHFDEALAIVDGVAVAEPQNPEVPQVRASILAARRQAPGVGVSASAGISRVSSRGFKRDWKEAALGLDAAMGRHSRMAVDVGHFDRSGVADTRFGTRLDRKIGQHASAYIGASWTPNADFLEQWSLRGGGEIRVSPKLSVTLDGRHAVYGTGAVNALEPGLRLQTTDGRLAISARSINLWDETGRHRLGWSARADVVATHGVLLFAGAASYPDTEAGVTRRVDSFFAGGDVGLTRSLSLRISVDRERRVDSYRRTGLIVALRWRPAG
jgi:YaiO family outer membrane protein